MSQTAYFIPRTVAEALETAGKIEPGYRYFAGGTDLQIYYKQGLVREKSIIDLSEIADLKYITFEQGRLNIGALTTLDELARSEPVSEKFPLLKQAALAIATPVIRKTATVGGNLLVKNRCNFYNQSADWRLAIGSCLRDQGDICRATGGKNKCFSRNVSDLAPALLALEATISIQNREESFSVPLAELYQSDGINNHRHLEKGALLTQISVSRNISKWYFRKLRLRRSLDYTSLTLAATLDCDDEFRIGINGMSMAPVTLRGRFGDLSLEHVQRTAARECKTVDNDLLPLPYRRRMLRVYLEEMWRLFSG